MTNGFTGMLVDLDLAKAAGVGADIRQVRRNSWLGPPCQLRSSNHALKESRDTSTSKLSVI